MRSYGMMFDDRLCDKDPLVERALEASGGSRQRAAAILGINRTTLFNKMKKYKLLSFPTRLDPEAGGRPRP